MATKNTKKPVNKKQQELYNKDKQRVKNSNAKKKDLAKKQSKEKKIKPSFISKDFYFGDIVKTKKLMDNNGSIVTGKVLTIYENSMMIEIISADRMTPFDIKEKLNKIIVSFKNIDKITTKVERPKGYEDKQINKKNNITLS